MKVGRGLDPARMWDICWENFRELLAVPFLGGKVLAWNESGTPGTKTVTIQHGLGRPPQGYLVQRAVDCAVHYETGTATATDIAFTVTTTAATSRFQVRVY